MIEILTIENSSGVTLAYLNNLESGAVHEIINGEYVISFICMIEELKSEYLYSRDNLIIYNNDSFRVAQLEELHNENGVITVLIQAEHISYDLIENTRTSFRYSNKAAIYVMNEALLNSGFTFTGTDVITTESIDLTESKEGAEDLNTKNIIHNIALIWGGELQYFRNQIELLQQRGTNRGVDFRFGKNTKNIRRIVNLVENTVSYEVEVIQGTELQALGYFEIGDTVRVIDDALNIDFEVRIVELEKDIVSEINNKVILGNQIKDLTSEFSKAFDEFKRTNSKLDKISVDFGNAITEINSDIGDLQQAIEDGVIVTYYQDDSPNAIELNVGDMWYCTADSGAYAGRLWRWNGTAWNLIQDVGITEAIAAAQNAQDTADGKIKTYFQNDPPPGASVGDIWFDTNDGNKQYRYNGSEWKSVRDGALVKVDRVIDEHGKLIASMIAGTLSTAIAKITDGTGYVTYGPDGILVLNQPTAAASTEALKISSAGLLIANAKNADGSWKWRTAITGKSISADAITTGVLTAINIMGVLITGSTIISESGTYRVEIKDGKLIIKDTALNNAGLIISYRSIPDRNMAVASIEGDINDNIDISTTLDDSDLNAINITLWADAPNYSGRLIEQSFSWRGTSSGKPWGECAIAFDSGHANNLFVVRGGSKNAVVETEEFGDVYFSAYETSEIYFGHLGEEQVVGGECTIDLPPKLTACCNMDIPYQVFLQKYGPGDIWVEQRNKNNFIVKGDDVRFAYEIKARRIGFEGYCFGNEDMR